MPACRRSWSAAGTPQHAVGEALGLGDEQRAAVLHAGLGEHAPVEQRPAEVVGAAAQQPGGEVDAVARPRRLQVRDAPGQHQARDGGRRAHLVLDRPRGGAQGGAPVGLRRDASADGGCAAVGCLRLRRRAGHRHHDVLGEAPRRVLDRREAAVRDAVRGRLGVADEEHARSRSPRGARPARPRPSADGQVARGAWGRSPRRAPDPVPGISRTPRAASSAPARPARRGRRGRRRPAGGRREVDAGAPAHRARLEVVGRRAAAGRRPRMQTSVAPGPRRPRRSRRRVELEG